MSIKPGLGKGLEALIPKTYLTSGKTIANIPISEIKPNPFQPRKVFDEDSIASLAISIKNQGVVQPILVRRVNNYYELIAGERRYRASIQAGLEFIPCIIKNISDKEAFELALIENLQREDLNPIEIASGYQRLIEEFEMTHQSLSEIFGKSRSAITNTLRLLGLPQSIQEAITKGQVTEGHGRALLSLPNQDDMLSCFEHILQKNLNVRQTEQFAANFSNEKKQVPIQQELLDFFKSVSAELENLYAIKLKIKGNKKIGSFEIKYKSEEDFERIYNLLKMPSRQELKDSAL